ncbi:MAG: MerR family transcriptional regulator [Streptosporangiaceae bacterium]|nr:MerR family transcriptional regulator [Streptosporangiaceae bacterium]MBV9855678.1 MerR family transcriptional regulator [Streptosporangiaceae bacterium]
MTGASRPRYTSARDSRAKVGIGQVLAQLRPEFPDISTSKIRFLEAEGLIEPARSQSGYRRFAAADVERLRYILTAQRDEYLPLRVIRERLAAMDRARAERGEPGTGHAEPGGYPSRPEPASMTRRELIASAAADDEIVAELEDYGLIRRGRLYGQDALAVTRAAVSLREFGVQPRHLRAVKAAAERETSLVEQVVAPLARQRGGREPAVRTAGQIAALIAQLHATLVETGLAEAGLAAEFHAAGSYLPLGRGLPSDGEGLRSASGR